MRPFILIPLTMLFCLSISCQKASAPVPRREEAFFASQKETADKINELLPSASFHISPESIMNVSYMHTSEKSFAFVFYESPEGPRNMVISRTYSADGKMEKESASTCTGNECTCKVTAIIDNQGNITIGCSCASCIMISNP